MVAEFDRTRKFADQRGSSGFLGNNKAGGATRLPGPHFILENTHAGVVEDEKRSRASEAAALESWFGMPHAPSPNEPAPYEVADMEYDGEDGPPGLPVFLARARAAEASRGEQPPSMYEDDSQQMMEIAPKPWTIPELNEMLSGNPHLLGSDGMPLIHSEGTPDMSMFQHPPPLNAMPPQFMQQHQHVGMFLGYPQQFPPAPPEPTYMQQSSFG